MKEVSRVPLLKRKVTGGVQVQVEEPSVQDTIQILRGIADKYASFHGVRIQDRALVAAAELSARYIQGRFRAYPFPTFADPHKRCLSALLPLLIYKNSVAVLDPVQLSRVLKVQ